LSLTASELDTAAVRHGPPSILAGSVLALRSRRSPRLSFFFALVGCVVLLAGCKVDATVDVTVRENGSGVVRVIVRADAEAVKAAESGGVPIDKAVRLSDVADAGFRVGTWEKADDGSATVVISRPFRNVSEVEGIVSALDGADGPMPGLRASRSRGLIATDYGVQGRIDLDKVTTGVNDDKELLTRLQALGVDVAAIDAQLLAQVRSSFSLKVVVRLPDEKPVTFTPKKGTNAATVDASSQILNTARIALMAAALGLLLLAVVVWIRGGRQRRRRRSPAPRDDPDAGRASPDARPPHSPGGRPPTGARPRTSGRPAGGSPPGGRLDPRSPRPGPPPSNRQPPRQPPPSQPPPRQPPPPPRRPRPGP
jgi:hypothetical protein